MNTYIGNKDSFKNRSNYRLYDYSLDNSKNTYCIVHKSAWNTAFKKCIAANKLKDIKNLDKGGK